VARRGDPRTPTAEAVIIGNEVLSGKVRDENAPYLIDVLRRLGVALTRVTVVPDAWDAIVETVSEAHRRADHVFTSGGVGPTHDDITLPCVAAALGRPIIRHEGLERMLHDLYGDRLQAAHLRMADVPEGTELVMGDGLMVPAVRCENVFVLPGVPSIFRQKVDVIARWLGAVPYHARYVFVQTGEGALAPILHDVVARFPDVDVGSYPRLDSAEYKTKVTLESKERARTEAALEALLERLPEGALIRVEDPGASQSPA
jgi:molybdenum cofactor synthesis domain-containing protein